MGFGRGERDSAVAGVATAVAPQIVIACTRKTVPFTRRLSIKAVHAGGGAMHRTGLSDSVLLFPEHRVFAASDDTAAVAREDAPAGAGALDRH